MIKILLLITLSFIWPVTATAEADGVMESSPVAENSEDTEFMPESSTQGSDDRFYLAPFGTFFKPGGDRNAQDGWGAGLGFGKMLNEYFNVEVRGFWQGAQANGYPNYKPSYERLPWDHGSINLAGGAIDLQYYLSRDTFAPYTVFSLGAMSTSYLGSLDWPPFDDDSRGTNISFIFEAGAGATYELADNFLLRGDVRYRGDTAPSNFRNSDVSVVNDLLVNLGFVIPIGDKPAPGAAPVAAEDCAARDSDHDGANDCEDKCAGTAGGTKVDEQGCPVVMELRGVNFQFDSAQLTPDSRVILDGVTEELIAFQANRDIEVAGYASDEGKPGKARYNQQLSARRSESVANYLRDKGVTLPLYVKGYGTEHPIADNATAAGRARNRRVELRWMGS